MHFFLKSNQSISINLPLISLTVLTTNWLFSGEPNQHTVTLNINIKNENKSDNTTTATSDTNVKNAQAQSQEQKIEPSKAIQEKMDNLWELIGNHKYQLMGCSLVAGYGYLFARVLADHWFVRSNDTWSSWKKDKKIEELQRSPLQPLRNELIHDIQIDHVSSPDPINASAPLAEFMKRIESEINRINGYLKISTILQRTRLLLIFPTNSATIELAHKKLKRAQFIKQLFVSWAAEYKMQHNLKLA